MAEAEASAPTVGHYLIAPIKHPIRAARLLYTPASYVLRGPIYLIFVIAFGAIVYSCWATVDQLVSAPLLLQREANVVESVGNGMVVDVPATENTAIAFGEPLVTVQEQTRITATTEQSEIEGKQFDIRREMDKLTSEYDHQISQIELDLQDLTTNRDTNKTALEGTIAQIEQQRDTASRSKTRADERLALAKKQFERTQQLYDSKDITVTEYEQKQAQVQELEKDVDDARAEIAKINVSLATSKEELGSLLDLRRKDKLEDELVQVRQRKERDLQRLQEQLESLSARLESGKELVEGVTFDESNTEYTSNYNGLVTDVHVRRGQMITPGTPLVTIVRETAVLEARALVSNQDIGHLQLGQPVKIKYFAYPYQEYGIPEGNISEISKKPGGVEGAESMYIVKVALEDETIAKRGTAAKALEIGLEGLAEIKTGEKRMIELVFSPVSRFFEGESEQAEGADEATDGNSP